MKIKDRFTLGAIAGLAASGAAMALQYGMYRRGWTSSTWGHQAAGATVSAGYANRKGATVLGVFTSLSVDALLATGQTYVYSLTGTDKSIVKATAMGVFSWLTLHGVATRLTHAFEPKDSPPRTSAVSLLSSLIDSYITSAIILRLGDESLFPPRPEKARPEPRLSDYATRAGYNVPTGRSFDSTTDYH